MQARSTPMILLPGDPYCAPCHVVVTESLTTLLRTLHKNDVWNATLNKVLLGEIETRRQVGRQNVERVRRECLPDETTTELGFGQEQRR